MKNKNMPAMPQSNKEIATAFLVQGYVAPNGYTKREQAAITILSGLAANQFNVNDTADSLTHRAIELADKLFDELEA